MWDQRVASAGFTTSSPVEVFVSRKGHAAEVLTLRMDDDGSMLRLRLATARGKEATMVRSILREEKDG
jgi:hypothetical protein